MSIEIFFSNFHWFLTRGANSMTENFNYLKNIRTHKYLHLHNSSCLTFPLIILDISLFCGWFSCQIWQIIHEHWFESYIKKQFPIFPRCAKMTTWQERSTLILDIEIIDVVYGSLLRMLKIILLFVKLSKYYEFYHLNLTW